MKKIFLVYSCVILLAACGNKSSSTDLANKSINMPDTLEYPYKALYSSDMKVPSNPENAVKVLEVWKAFEMKQIEAKRAYFADVVTYNSANGFHFHGAADTLLAIASKETNALDSLRFDISAWQSAHINNRNEDWVYGRPDTFLTQENWRLKDGKIVYFDQFTAKQHK
jgi:hypothetical protein